MNHDSDENGNRNTIRKIYTITSDDLNQYGKLKLAPIITGTETANYEIRLNVPPTPRPSAEEIVLTRINKRWFEEQEEQLLNEAKMIMVENRLQKGDAHEELLQLFFRKLLDGTHRIVGKFQIITNNEGEIERYNPQSDVVVCRGGTHVKLSEMKNIGVSDQQVLAVVESKTTINKEECQRAAKELRTLHCPCAVFAFGAGNATNQKKVAKLSTVCRWVNVAFAHSPQVRTVIITPRTHVQPFGDGYVLMRDGTQHQYWNYIVIPVSRSIDSTNNEFRGVMLIALVYSFAFSLSIGEEFENAIAALFDEYCLPKVMIQQPSQSALPLSINHSNGLNADEQMMLMRETNGADVEKGRNESKENVVIVNENYKLEQIMSETFKTCILS